MQFINIFRHIDRFYDNKPNIQSQFGIRNSASEMEMVSDCLYCIVRRALHVQFKQVPHLVISPELLQKEWSNKTVMWFVCTVAGNKNITSVNYNS